MVETSKAAPLTLRERTRAAMREEVSEVAFRLFARQGFDKTTVEQIAAEAGLSRTTFFRYFGSKEELILGRMGEFGPQIAAALAARPAGEGHWEALRRCFDVITEANTGEPQSFLELMRLFDDACAVMTRQWEKTEGWQSLLVPQMRRRLGGDGQVGSDLRAQALVGSAISCLDAASDAWRAAGGATPLSELLDQAMGVLAEPPA